MKYKLLIKTFFIFLPLLSFGQQRWETIISDENVDYGVVHNSLTYDLGEIISAGGGNYSNKSFIFKIDKNGQELFRKTFIYDDWNTPTGAKQDKKGNLMVYGTTGDDASVVMLDACGNMQWCSMYNESEDFGTIYSDGIFLDNGNIILLMSIDYKDGIHMDMGLMCYDTNGNMLWYHPYNMIQKYPRLYGIIMPWQIKKFGNFLIISGLGYYSYPDNPGIGLLKPMFVKTDSLFNEEWLLPYGLADSSTNDTILGIAAGVVSYNNGILHGWGRASKPMQGYYTSILMNFDTSGQETNYHIITNEMIDSTATENFFMDVYQRDDTSYFTSIKYGNQGWENPSGEVIMDTAGNVYQSQSHPEANLQGGYWPIAKDTINNQYYLAYYNFEWDIVLYKFNADLSDAEIDTVPHNYDTLCPNLPIVSDTIYVTGCDVITALPEFPTPQAYYKAKQTVELTAYPNPTYGGTINFKLKYTKYHRNIQLAVYDISGKRMVTQQIATGQEQASFGVSAFPPGMYVAVVRDSKRVLGKAVFSVVE